MKQPVATALSEHLVAMPGGDWALWRWTAVRGAGFSASWPSRVGAPVSAALADALLDLEAQAEHVREQALESLRGALNSAHDRIPIIEAIRLLKKGKCDGLAVSTVDERLQELRVLHARLHAAHEHYRTEFEHDTARVSDNLCHIMADDRFREALLWQNREAVTTAIEPLLRKRQSGESRNARQRKQEGMVASYLQRYCLKNETIGFFGPVGWAVLTSDVPALVATPGPGLLADRTVYFEMWSIDALADALATDMRLDVWLAPRLAHFVDLENTTLFLPNGESIDLSAGDAALLRVCDGKKTVKQIAAALTRDPSTGLNTDDDVLARVRELRDRQFISLALAVPIDLYPERGLERLLQRIDDAEQRERAMGALNALRQARDSVAHAAGDAEMLDRALDDLETCFTRVTGRAPTRSPGETYAARTLVFEDCRRDIDIRIGHSIVSALGPPLSLLLASARWLTADAARRYATVFDELHRDLARKAAPRPVTLASFVDAAYPALFADTGTLALDSQAEFQQRWARILDVDLHASSMEYSAAQLRTAVDAAFDSPGPGWPYARYHSPDLMIAARSVEDVRRGEYLLVLGEIHVASNTLGWANLLEQHPSRHELLRAAEVDLPEPRLEPVIPKRLWPGQTARLIPALLSSKDFRLEVSADPYSAGPETVRVGAFVVAHDGDRLVARTRDGRLEFDLFTVFAQVLSWEVMSKFRLMPRHAHCPRVTFDQLVVSRESWSVPPEDVAFASEKDHSQRFLAARRWARAFGFPRHVFVNAPVEQKPFYVDFESPLFVDNLAKTIRRSADALAPSTITVTEMLPEPDQAWLVDAHGTRYTSELRMVAVDLSADLRRAS